MVIICCFSLVFERYKSYSPYDMLESIKKEVKGDLENAFLNLGKQARPPIPGGYQLSVNCVEVEGMNAHLSDSSVFGRCDSFTWWFCDLHWL